MKTKSALIAEIDELVRAVGDKFDVSMSPDEEGDAERDFMAARCPPRLEATVRSLPTLSMHLLAAISEGPVSVVGLAARSGQLKGTVSKHVQRLVAEGLVARLPIPGNRKEVELALTDDGHTVSTAHDELHHEMAVGLHDFLKAYGSTDLRVLVTVLLDLVSSEKVGVRLTRQ
ncbi:MarR family transcriptional regulator [Mycolicibacterium sp.]|uniref:MarR family winged helix-turn-helix transcriptional regulator n=1 Tax=Mycolicibacterium sp. TaxID=2320850 RepID=UPI001A28FE5A|nr:MarR family transcriptional regulator [Mycolicibacterium sp.]MBJ7339938.1 MarR family transcriptional regulator [Mycolicibacterium sp.]